jgi:hypothetical protein
MGEEEFIQGLMGKPEIHRLLGRHKRMWEDNIKMDLREDGVVCGFIWLRVGSSGGLF